MQSSICVMAVYDASNHFPKLISVLFSCTEYLQVIQIEGFSKRCLIFATWKLQGANQMNSLMRQYLYLLSGKILLYLK
jgi:hypothetical protein